MRLEVLEREGSLTMRTMKVLVALGALSVIHGSGAPAPLLARQATADGPAQGAGRADLLATAPDLAGLEGRIRAAIEKASPAVVYLGAGTGTIISPEGLILTQGHVLAGPMEAGARSRLSFHDGTAAEAALVGVDPTYDLALLRMMGPGPYPFARLAELDPVPGTAVLKFGYPIEAQLQLGSLKGRPASVRFGAVLAVKPNVLVTDCAQEGGDSGGPYVDLDGRVVGIVRSRAQVLDEPTGSVHMHNLYNTRGRSWHVAFTSTLIRTRLARMAGGEFIELNAAERDRYDTVSPSRKDPFLYRDLIPGRLWTQGEQALGRFRDAAAGARRGVVEVLDGDETTALGTVVDASGLVLTKASRVPQDARCRLPGGRVAPAEVVGVDPAYDLALLRVPTEGVVPVAWAEAADPPAGTLLAAAGPGELPLTLGIVSLPRRDTPGPHPAAPRRYSRPDLIAGPPELIGFVAPDGGFVVEASERNAAAAGIRPGDVVLTIAGEPVPDNSWLKRAPKPGAGFGIPITGMNRYDQSYYTFQSLPLATTASEEARDGKKIRRAGERVPVRLLRGGEPIELSLELPPPREKELGFAELMAWSFPPTLDDAPPTVFTADLPAYGYSECGAPVVGVDGAVLGLVIKRFGSTGSLVIPADRVAARLADLKRGKPLTGFPAPAAGGPAPASNALRKRSGATSRAGHRVG